MADFIDEMSPKAAIQAAWRSAGGPERQRLKLAYARLPMSLQAALRRFRKITGHTAVTAILNPARALAEGGPPAPPVHPRCAEALATVEGSPCEGQWQQHIRESLRSGSAHSHVCPLGLHCSCVPIHLGESLVGAAKVVLDADTSASDCSAATATLALTVSLACQESYTSVLREQLAELQRSVGGVRKPGAGAGAHDAAAAEVRAADAEAETAERGRLVDRALDLVHARYRESDLTVRTVAQAVGCSENYLSGVFRRVVGRRLSSYLTGLRVDEACRALLESHRSIKAIALDCGFAGARQLARSFGGRVGVSPSAYRRIFRGC